MVVNNFSIVFKIVFFFPLEPTLKKSGNLSRGFHKEKFEGILGKKNLVIVVHEKLRKYLVIHKTIITKVGKLVYFMSKVVMRILFPISGSSAQHIYRYAVYASCVMS